MLVSTPAPKFLMMPPKMETSVHPVTLIPAPVPEPVIVWPFRSSSDRICADDEPIAGAGEIMIQFQIPADRDAAEVIGRMRCGCRSVGDRPEEERLPEVAVLLPQALVLTEWPVENQVLVGPPSLPARVFVYRPAKAFSLVLIRVACSRKARPVARDGTKEREIVRVQHVVRRWSEVVSEDEVSVEPVNDEVGSDRVYLTLEGIQVDGRPRPLDEACDPARLAHDFDVARQPRQRQFWRRKVGPPGISRGSRARRQPRTPWPRRPGSAPLSGQPGSSGLHKSILRLSWRR